MTLDDDELIGMLDGVRDADAAGIGSGMLRAAVGGERTARDDIAMLVLALTAAGAQDGPAPGEGPPGRPGAGYFAVMTTRPSATAPKNPANVSAVATA